MNDDAMSMPSPPLRVLLVDDDPDDYRLTLDILERLPAPGATVDWACEYRDGLNMAERGQYDVCLVDYRLGAETGLDFLRAMQSSGQSTPVILLTGLDSPETEMTAARTGAADYLIKGRFDVEQLRRSLHYAVERARLLTQVRAGEERYRLLFERSPTPILICDPAERRIVLANLAALQLYGYSREEFLGKSIFDLWPPDEAAALRADAVDCFSPNREVYRHRNRAGDSFDVRMRVEKVELEGRPACIIMVADVTSQLRAERARREQSRRLRQILGDVGDALLVVGSDRRIRLANAAAGHLLDTPADRLEGQELPLPLEAACAGTGELALTRADGAAVELETLVSQTRWEGEPAAVYTLRDLTMRRHTEARMRLLERAIETSSNGVVICDARMPDRPMIYANAAFARMTGYPMEELLGRNPRFLQGTESAQAGIEQLRQALSGDGHCHVDLRNYRKDGRMFWNRMTITPIVDRAGEISHYLGISEDITREIEHERRLAELARLDPVTRLPLFSAIKDEIRETLAEASAGDGVVALMLIDVDRFDDINRSLGHEIGNRALSRIARRLRTRVEKAGVLTRLAGDQFVAIVPSGRHRFDAMAFAEAIRRDMQRPLQVPPYELDLSCTVGLALYPDHADNIDALLIDADMAMKRGKREGRNAVFAFRPEFAEELRDRLTLGARLRDALLGNEMVLHYQPQLSGQDGRIVGLEALVRWCSPELGLIMPSRFIDVAEDLGIVVPLGQWVLKTACRQLRHWLDEGLHDVSVSVNVSGQQFQREGFVAEVRDLLHQHELPSGCLELEITESAIMDGIERVRRTMAGLKALGVRLALDDFGTGYSSLSYLKRLPIDKLKIDRCFVADVTTDSNDAAIARAIIAMGHQLRLTLLAEGIETQEQLGFLRRNHCDMFQGYLISRPVDAETAGRMLRGRFLMTEAFMATRPDRTLLLVDDEENILRSLVRLFRREGYRVLTASSLDQAFNLLAGNHVQVILSDQRMPDGKGTDFLGKVKELYPDTIRLILSGYTDLGTVTEAINRGAIYRFLTKPWSDEELLEHIREAFRASEQGRLEFENAPQRPVAGPVQSTFAFADQRLGTGG